MKREKKGGEFRFVFILMFFSFICGVVFAFKLMKCMSRMCSCFMEHHMRSRIKKDRKLGRKHSQVHSDKKSKNPSFMRKG